MVGNGLTSTGYRQKNAFAKRLPVRARQSVRSRPQDLDRDRERPEVCNRSLLDYSLQMAWSKKAVSTNNLQTEPFASSG